MLNLKLSTSYLPRSTIIVIVLLIMVLLSPFVSPLQAVSEAPKTEWDRTYGAITGVAVFPTDDGGCAIAGTTGTWGVAPQNDYGTWLNLTFLLIKTDAFGEVQWSRNYTRGNTQFAVLTRDGGYALAGTKEDTLIKIDTQGNVQWSKKYAIFSEAYVSSVIQTIDGGFAIVGYGYNPLYRTEPMLVKTDSNGNIQWSKTYGEPSESRIVLSIVQTIDDGFALAGSTRGDMWFVKTDSVGDVLWETKYGGQDAEICSSVVRTTNGGYLLTGSTASFGAGDYDGWVVKTDSNGKMQWNKTYGGAGRDDFRAAAITSDGGYVLVGSTDVIKNPVAAVVKFDAFGELEWEKNFSGENRPESVTVASDGGYFFAGLKGNSNNRESVVWAVKIAPDYSVQETEPPPSESSELFYAALIVVVIMIGIVVLGLGLLVYFMKRNR
jgi:hypothetical protein